MWLITTLIASIIVTVIYWKTKNTENRKYKLDILALMLWGTFIMIFVDHIIAFMDEGGEFISVTTDGLITSGTLLGVAMIFPLLLIWVVFVFTRKQKS